MRTSRTTKTTAIVVGATALVLTACSSMTWDQKLEHLRHVAERGADAHYVLKTENKETTKEVCTEHYPLFTEGAPVDQAGATGASQEWRALSLEYFVDSCVKGEPRQIHTRPATPSSTPSAPASPTESPASAPPAG